MSTQYLLLLCLMVAKLDTLVKVTVVDFISASSAQYSMNHLLDYDYLSWCSGCQYIVYMNFSLGAFMLLKHFLFFSENQYCAILFRYRKSLNEIFCCLHIEKENPFFDLFIQWKITALKGAVYHSYCTSALQYASMTMLNMVTL